MNSSRIVNKNSSGLAASLVVSANPAVLYGLTVYNGKSSAQYIQIHDAASLPADTAVPTFPPIRVDTLDTVSISFPEGRNFATGIIVCNSSTAATKTIGSADCIIDAQVGALMA